MMDYSQYIRLEVMSGNNLQVPSCRIPAGIYVSIYVDSNRRWKSAVRVLSSDSSIAAWGDTVTLSPDESPKLSLEIMASFELDRMLGRGEVISKVEMSWHELLGHGDEPFDLFFPPIRGVQPSLMLKVAVVQTRGNQDGALFDSIRESEIARRTYAGHTRFAKYMTRQSVADLTDAVEQFQVVLNQCPVGHQDHSAALTNLAWARLQGYIHKDLQDIDSVTSLFRDALVLRPQGHLDRPLSLYHLTETLTWCQNATASIREATQLYYELLPLCSQGTYLWRVAVNDIDYVIRNCNNLPIEASEEGIHLRRTVFKLCHLGHPRRPVALAKLAQAVELRFEQCGNIDDIDESIQLRRDLVSLYPEGHPSRGTQLGCLATALRLRFIHEGKSRDMDEAISLHEEVLLLHPVGHGSRYRALSSLGGAIFYRVQQRSGTSDINDINRAISLYRDTLMLRPPGDSSRETTLSNLASALIVRYRKAHVIDDLHEAIDLFRKSLWSMRSGSWAKHRRILNLSLALCSRFRHTRKNCDIEEAIHFCKHSLKVLPALHPERCLGYMRLQQVYLCRYQIQRNPVCLLLAVENSRLASRHPTQGFPQRILATWNWVVAAEDYCHESALEAYAMFFELLDGHLATRSSTISRREAASVFQYARSLPANAASCSIRRNNLPHAVELVEQGRGQLWSLASRFRTPLEDLHSKNPDKARKFSELSKRVSDAQYSTANEDSATADVAEREYRRLMVQWDAEVADIRNLDGFERFLLPPSYNALQAAACQSPVIIFIASEYSCSAIIVPTSGEPRHVAFPDIASTQLKKLKEDFAQAIRHAACMPPEEPRKELRVLLRTVWDKIMLPIVNILQHDLGLRHQSRIWLCPTAAFTTIPLHAAHPFRMKADHSGLEACLEDIYICSYTPTLSALIRSRETMKTSVTQSFAAIGQSRPGAGQGTVLATVDSELELVHKLVPPNVKFTNISGNEATQAGALEALQCNTWVHLACHSKQDRDEPYNSRFAMRDKPLTLLDIMKNNAPQAEFAFLSACHTAVSDETPDEVIHLAAGLQFSGFKSVIGTLWVVDDAVAKHVVEAFYERIFKDLKGGLMDCTKAAWALNRATWTVKNKVPLEQRIVFIHIGV